MDLANWDANWNTNSFGTAIPIKEFDESDPPVCAECAERIEEFAVYDGEDSHYCYDCQEKVCELLRVEAYERAVIDCKITNELPTFDLTAQWACTAEEYEMGCRESYTENAFRCECRHRFTNYEKLIADLDRYNMYDKVEYWAIRFRIDELIEEEIENKNLFRPDDENCDDDGADDF